MSARTAPGAWAWCLALISFPFAFPLYWVFGRKTFRGYETSLRVARQENQELVEQVIDGLEPHFANLHGEEIRYGEVLQKLSERRFTRGNQIELLIDGEATFREMFAAIEKAQSYILVQFFIVKNDDLGRKFRDLLIKKAKSGTKIYFLYDEIGSHSLPKRGYLNDLTQAGIETAPFQTTQGRTNRFQINFRNHRKILVVDGKTAFVGGLNIGDEYLGKNPKFGHWRDTHVKIIGPAVQSTQLIFVTDWYWAVQRTPEVRWHPDYFDPDGGMTVLPLQTGPVDTIEGGTLFLLNSINRSRKRFWITSPYFVPDETIRNALQLAALRGVDVKIMIPDVPDKRIPWLAGFSYIVDMESAGARVFRYSDGFLHQKAFIVDDEVACVGTMNLDNRSLRLNFEVSIIVIDQSFCQEVATMLEEDFATCREVDGTDYTSRPIWFRILVRLARLTSPVL